MNNIEYANDTRTVHSLFIDWLNSMLTSYVSGPWDDFVSSVLSASFVRSTNVFLQEMYSMDGNTLVGYVVFTDVDSTYRAVYFDTATNTPQNVCSNGLEEILEMSDGVVVRFTTDKEATFSGGTVMMLNYREIFGVLFPALTMLSSSGDFIAMGVMDMIYNLRTSGTYTVNVTNLDLVPQMELENVSKTVLNFSLPLLEGFEVKYKVLPKQKVIVPRTPSSEYFVVNSFDDASMRYKFL